MVVAEPKVLDALTVGVDDGQTTRRSSAGLGHPRDGRLDRKLQDLNAVVLGDARRQDVVESLGRLGGIATIGDSQIPHVLGHFLKLGACQVGDGVDRRHCLGKLGVELQELRSAIDQGTQASHSQAGFYLYLAQRTCPAGSLLGQLFGSLLQVDLSLGQLNRGELPITLQERVLLSEFLNLGTHLPMGAHPEGLPCASNPRLLVGRSAGLCQIFREAFLLVAQIVGVNACRLERGGQLSELRLLTADRLLKRLGLRRRSSIGHLLGLGGLLGRDQFVSQITHAVPNVVELLAVLD